MRKNNRKLISVLICLAFLLSLSSTTLASAQTVQDTQPNQKELVTGCINKYFQFRQDSFYISNKKITQSAKKAELGKMSTSAVLSDEEDRQDRHYSTGNTYIWTPKYCCIFPANMI